MRNLHGGALLLRGFLKGENMFSWAKAITIIGVTAIVFVGATWSPFQNEIRTILGILGPWIPALIALFLLHSALTQAVATMTDIISRVLKFVLALLMFVAAAIFIFPVMIGNLVMLGPLALWMFKFHVGPIILTILSLLAYALIALYEGRATWAFAKTYLVIFIVIGFGIVLGGYVYDGLSNTHRIDYKLVAGFPSPDPLESIKVKPGDKLTFDAFGAVWEGGVRRSIQGDEAALIPYDGWYRRKGEMMFRIANTDRRGNVISDTVLGQNLKSGPSSIASIDIGPYTSGYHLSGEAVIPDGVSGHLLVGFFGAAPNEGFVRLTVKVNQSKSQAAAIGRRLMGKEKPLPDKQETRAIIRIIGLIVLGSIVIGGGVAGWRAKEGLLFHLPTILLSAVIVAILLFVVEWFAYDNGGFATLWRNFVALWRR